MSLPRMRLKHAAGWFAAGREVTAAMGLLLDAAFKAFIWLCLHAERSSGRLLVEPATIARTLSKTEVEIHAILEDLFQAERAAPPPATHDAWTYTAKVRQLMQARACVSTPFSAADYTLAMELYQRKIPLQTLERAIHLGCLRKYAALLNHPGGTLIASLYYFALLLEEVQRMEITDQYWSYINLKLRQLEQQWQTAHLSAAVGAEPPRRDNETSETKRC